MWEQIVAIVRCMMESLALKYLDTITQLEDIVQSSIGKLHIVGGGVQNRNLSQWTADATGREVIAGPVEATAIGNVGMQILCAGRVKDLRELRRVIRESFSPERFIPNNSKNWNEEFERYKKRKGNTPLP